MQQLAISGLEKALPPWLRSCLGGLLAATLPFLQPKCLSICKSTTQVRWCQGAGTQQGSRVLGWPWIKVSCPWIKTSCPIRDWGGHLNNKGAQVADNGEKKPSQFGGFFENLKKKDKDLRFNIIEKKNAGREVQK